MFHKAPFKTFNISERELFLLLGQPWKRSFDCEVEYKVGVEKIGQLGQVAVYPSRRLLDAIATSNENRQKLKLGYLYRSTVNV